ncbi:hypothetical protein C3L33_02300, partial [Rhododendron williamsianum]
MERIAAGLEKSGAKFLWCIKEAPQGSAEGGDFGVIPSGFEDRTAGRGLVVREWAPQGLVAGVPMLAWPMEGEQFLNATLLVDELKVATRICEGAQTVLDSNELARVVAESVLISLGVRT